MAPRSLADASHTGGNLHDDARPPGWCDRSDRTEAAIHALSAASCAFRTVPGQPVAVPVGPFTDNGEKGDQRRGTIPLSPRDLEGQDRCRWPEVAEGDA